MNLLQTILYITFILQFIKLLKWITLYKNIDMFETYLWLPVLWFKEVFMVAVQQSAACPAQFQFQFRVTIYHKTQELHVQRQNPSSVIITLFKEPPQCNNPRSYITARARKFPHCSGQTRYWVTGNRNSFRGGNQELYFATASRNSLGSIQPPGQRKPKRSSPGGKSLLL
jgi:hypothetical protein